MTEAAATIREFEAWYWSLDPDDRPDFEDSLALWKQMQPVALPLSAWHEDDGPVVWWTFPVEESAWIGTPNDIDWRPGYYTHWTPHPVIPEQAA